MPPSNTTAATATNIASLPFSTTQNVWEAGVTYTVWYKYTAVSGDNMIGLWAHGDFTGIYVVRTVVYQGPDTSLVQWILLTLERPVQFPVTQGTTYYFEFEKRADLTPASATLVLDVLKHTETVESEAYFMTQASVPGVNGNNAPPMAAFLSGVNDHVITRYVGGFPTGEAGDRLADGTIMLSEAYQTPKGLQVFNSSYTQIANIAFDIGTGVAVRAHHPTNRFWAGKSQYRPVLKEYSNLGVELATVTLNFGSNEFASLAGICVDSSRTFVILTETTPGMPIWKVNLSTLARSIIVSSLTMYLTIDLIMLPDDTFLALYIKGQDDTPDIFVRRYTLDGAVVETYASIEQANFIARIGFNINDPDYFHIYGKVDNSTPTTRWRKVRLSDGVVVRTRDYVQFSSGVYTADPPAVPIARFGHDPSCPVIPLGGGDSPEPTPPGIVVIVEGKRTDIDEAIPTPTFRTGLLP